LKTLDEESNLLIRKSNDKKDQGAMLHPDPFLFPQIISSKKTMLQPANLTFMANPENLDFQSWYS